MGVVFGLFGDKQLNFLSRGNSFSIKDLLEKVYPIFQIQVAKGSQHLLLYLEEGIVEHETKSFLNQIDLLGFLIDNEIVELYAHAIDLSEQ